MRMLEALIPIATYLTEFFSDKLLDWGLDRICLKKIKAEINSKIKCALEESIENTPNGNYVIENFEIESFFQDTYVADQLMLFVRPDDMREPDINGLQDVWKRKFGDRYSGNYQLFLSSFLRLLKQRFWEIEEIRPLLHMKETRVSQKSTESHLATLSTKLDRLLPVSVISQTEYAITEFSRRTQKSLENVSREVPGILGPIYRKEILDIEEKLINKSPVVLAGEAGTGKSGIGASIAYTRIQDKSPVLFLDVRKIVGLKTEKQLAEYLNLRDSVYEAVTQITTYSKFSLIIDQLDNIAGMPLANLLIELACECSKLSNIEIVVISRDFEVDGKYTLVDDLMKKGFQKVESRKLDKEEVLTLLTQLKINDSPEVVDLSQNLLNLKIIAKIKQEQPGFNFSRILDEATLWDTYIDILIREETANYGSRQGKKLIQEAINLACNSLKHNQRVFPLEFSLSDEQERLRSWGIIRDEGSGQYRFQHEKMQDYFYALDATRGQKLSPEVIEELGVSRAKNILPFMNSIYERNNPKLHILFFKGIMYGQ
jgi:hypothetical protein